MRIPRFAFAALIVGILALASALAVNKVRARDTGTVILLNTTGPDNLNLDCSLSTQDKNQAVCLWFATVGSNSLGYNVRLLSRDGGRVLLAIRTRTYPNTPGIRTFGYSELDNLPAHEVWFEPGEPLQLNVPEVGTLTLKGEWLDHMPIFMGGQKPDLSPGPGDLRFASPLLLKDKRVAGDLLGSASGGVRTDDPNVNVAVYGYIPGEGRFLLSLLPIRGAVEAHVDFSRISFEEGGHSWEFVTGAPVSRAKKIWVLHQPDFKQAKELNPNSVSIGTYVLRQVQPGVWVPPDMTN